MSDPLEFLSGYVSPVTDKEHATIGRIAILWGQIEHFVEELLPHVTGLRWGELEALQITSKSISSKVDYLTAATARLTNTEYRNGVRAFCAIIHETKTQRNHIFHGMWGWRGDGRTQRVFAAARKKADPQAPFAASKLSALEKKLCRCSRMGFDLVVIHVLGQDGRPHPSRFFHHSVEGDAPEWLMQWSARNPWAGDHPDRIEQAGQLPRLSRLYPER